MYTLKEIADLRSKAIALKLSGNEILAKYSDEELQKIFNGIGPDRFPEELRCAISKLHPSLNVVAFIHDVRFFEGGNKEKFYKDNMEFKENGYTVADSTYAWYNPLRYRVRFFARQFARLCDRFGWSGYTKHE